MHGYDGDPYREYVRSTRAHNTVMISGGEQWISIRGHSTEKPVLLYLSGGPGQRLAVRRG